MMHHKFATISWEDPMSFKDSNPQTVLVDLISTDDAENATIEFEPAQLKLVSRAVEL
jgi:ligand-binding SRPBCC domain-containing protein